MGPAYSIAWAHPKYGNVLATCGYDHSVKVWQESTPNNWKLAHEENLGAPVHSLAWAPWEYGLILAAGSEDGSLVLLRKP